MSALTVLLLMVAVACCGLSVQGIAAAVEHSRSRREQSTPSGPMRGRDETINGCKRAARRWALAGLVGTAAALTLIPSSSIALAARGDGASDAYGRTLLALVALGTIALLGAVVCAAVAWAYALTGTRNLDDDRWFRAVLRFGIAGALTVPLFGIGVVIFAGALTAYVVAGPEQAAAPHVWSKAAIRRTSRRGWTTAGGGALLAIAAGNLTHPGWPLHGVLWPTLALVFGGLSIAVVGAVVASCGWWAAVFNANAHPDQTWARRLRVATVLGTLTMPLLGAGAILMAIVLATWLRNGPDGSMPPSRTQSESRRLAAA